MQMVERRWDGKDGLILRLATSREHDAGLDERLVQATYRARPLYREQAEEGHIHHLQIEWVRPGELVTHARTGKLVQVVDERPHD
jgi:hypothetical protein